MGSVGRAGDPWEDAADPFTVGFAMLSYNHVMSAPVGSNRNAEIRCDNATSRNRKGSQIGGAPCIVTFLLLISSCANLNPLKCCRVSSTAHPNNIYIRTCRLVGHR